MADRNKNGTFKKGHANLGGRHKTRRRIEPLLQAIGAEMVTIEEENGEPVIVTKLEAVLRKQYDLAIDGDKEAVRFISERTEGKPRDTKPEPEEDKAPLTLFDITEKTNA